ncbi:ABC transporter substrate-binding protein [Virgisporangium aliadipatigenens]|uniref:ABC transporter substrate-binding protein n=1 Tax=Virgisporangium aliadipatigenens TaxID=741659 RepID=A0A8J3YQ66_9ACTN|nr:ABC transporter substrate-binding protein [Virgisporangium aliadipatigenens]GIJ48303.1 ABC transporter substrate-binding protein [Virgisporangium aliadipatigenens]
MRRRLAVIAVAALSLSACNANSSDGKEDKGGTEKGGTLSILTSASSVTLDPAKSQNLAITTLGLLVRRLTTWDIQPGKTAKVVPDLATDTGTPSDGGRTWTYRLKDNLKFSDGTAITSADIKYGVERSFAPELSGGLSYHKNLLVGNDGYKGPYGGQGLSGIETPDEKTVVFKLKVPYGDWPWLVSMPAFAPVPKAGDAGPQKYGQNPISSGPYQVESYQQGNSLKLKRNPNWDQAGDPVRTAGPDQIVFQLGQDSAVVAQRLIADSGEDRNAFGASFVPPAQLAQIQQNAGAKQRLVTSEPGALAYLALNVTRPGLQDLKVRQAIQYAVDKKAFQVASGGTVGGDIATTLITQGIAGRQQFDLYPADPSGDVAKAKQLIAETGRPAPTLTLLVENGATDVSQAQAIQQGLVRAGFTVNIKTADEEAVTAETTGANADYDLTLASWQPDFPSANGNIQPLFESTEVGNGGYNKSRYVNGEVDALIKQATGETDPARAQGLWAQADKRILQDAPVVPLIYTKNSFLHGSNVQNFFVAGFPAYPNYLKVSLKR